MAADMTSSIATLEVRVGCCLAMARNVLTMRAHRSAALLILSARSAVLGSLRALLHHQGQAEDDRQRIVQFVGHARQQAAQRRHLFILVQGLALPLQFPLHLDTVREVVSVRDDDLLALEVDQPRGNRAPAWLAILALELGLELVDQPFPQQPLDILPAIHRIDVDIRPRFPPRREVQAWRGCDRAAFHHAPASSGC